MRVSISMTDDQVRIVDRLGSHLGLRRSEAIRYLLTAGIDASRARQAITDSADASLQLVMAAREEAEALRQMEERLHAGGGARVVEAAGQVLVTPAPEDKNGTSAPVGGRHD